MDPDEHLTAFVTAFVVSARKERWHHLIARRRGGRSASALFLDLDPRFCVQADAPPAVAPTRLGVLFRFWDEVEVTTAADAVARDHYQDALFSLDPGRLAVFFWHEGGCWVCRR